MGKKAYQGAVNDKERSKQKLINAVGEVIKLNGYTGLSALKIAKTAGLDRKLIKLYFGSTDSLIETYIRNKDYWVAATGNAGNLMNDLKDNDTMKIMETVLHNQLDFFYKEDEMQKIILWQLSQRSKIMFEIAEEREKIGADFFRLTDPFFEGSNVDLRAVSALLVAGIYHMVLHAKSNDSLFCEIDINTPEGISRIKKAISNIVSDTYSRVKVN